MRIQLFLTSGPLHKVDFEKKTVVVVDVLRSSTSICTILNAGARGVIPTAGPGEAGEMWTKLGQETTVLAGEREGTKIENFQLGNSPLEFNRETVGDKNVILCTTNGTGVFARVARAELTLSGALVNVSTVAAAVVGVDRDTIIVCSGHEGGFSIEDTLCGGMVIDLLKQTHGCYLELNDAATLALLLYEANRADLPKAIARGEHGRYLTEIGFGRDVEVSSEVDSRPVLPVMRDGRLVRVED
ncbi:MAG: 2-phosphosulfolactate phosphatase [bacterium]|nr:2-phosphosulfolactate phosphatase [bacterium]